MIDARDQVQSAVARKSRRSTAPVLQSRSKDRMSRQSRKLAVTRVFSDPKVKPFDQIEWDRRVAEITDDGGKVIFKQDNVEVPKSWSQLATKVVVSKYFYGEQNTSERETSVGNRDPRRSQTETVATLFRSRAPDRSVDEEVREPEIVHDTG